MIQLARLLESVRPVPTGPDKARPQAPQAPVPRMTMDQRVALAPRPEQALSNAVSAIDARLRGLQQELGALVRQSAAASDAMEMMKVQLEITQRQAHVQGLTGIRQQLVGLTARKDLTPVQVAKAGQAGAQASMAADVAALNRQALALRVIGAGRQVDTRLVNAVAALDTRLGALEQQARRLVSQAQATNDAASLQKIQIELRELDRQRREFGRVRDAVAGLAVSGRLDDQGSAEVATLSAMAANATDPSQLPKIATRIRVSAAGEAAHPALANATARLDTAYGALLGEAREASHQASITSDALTLQKLQIKLQDLDRRMDQLGRIRDTVSNLTVKGNVPASIAARTADLAYQASQSNDIVEHMRIATALRELLTRSR